MLLHLLGPPRLTLVADGNDVFRNEKAKLLLAFLARSRLRKATRQELIGMFWPDASDKRASASLRQAIRAIRSVQREYGCAFLETGQHAVELTGDDLTVDVDQIQDALKAGGAADVERAHENWRPEILAGAQFTGDLFEDWIAAETAALKRQFIETAIRRCENGALLTSAPDLAVLLYNFVLLVEPTHETAQLHLIAHYAGLGDRWAALQQFDRYTEAMQRDLGLMPSPEALQCIAPFLPRAGGGPGHARIGRPAIAVQVDETSPRLCAALALSSEELTHRLSAFKHLSLINLPSSVADRAGEGGTIKRKIVAADRPAGEYVLRIKPSASETRVTIELTDLVSGRLLLHDRIDLAELEGRADLDDLFGWRIARVERVVVNDVLEQDGDHTTAFACLAEANRLIRTFDPDSNDRAYALLDKTISSVGPKFAPIHAAIASAGLTRRLHRPDGDKPSELADARARIDTALTIDPWDPYSHRIAGWTDFQAKDYERGLNHFLASLDLNSSDPYATMACAEAFAYVGNIDKARDFADRSFRLLRSAPPYFFSYLATIFFSTGDYASCVALCDKGAGQSAEVKALKAAALGQLGKTEKAGRLIENLRSTMPGSTESGIATWLSDINMFREADVRAAYASGLEAAGLSTIRQHLERC